MLNIFDKLQRSRTIRDKFGKPIKSTITVGKNVDDDGFLAGVGAVAVETETAVLVQSRGPLKKPVPSSPVQSRPVPRDRQNGKGVDS